MKTLNFKKITSVTGKRQSGRGQNGCKHNNQETIAILQVTDDGSLDQGDSSGEGQK